MALLDRVAELTEVDDPSFAEVRAIYEGDARLRVLAEYGGDPEQLDLRRM